MDEEEDEPTVSNTTLLVPPGTKRTQRSRASSADSRVTQWLDFYPTPSQASNPQTSPLPESPPSDRLQGSDRDLRPLPLRVPSLERLPPTKTLARKNSKWKPLPTLPALPSQPLGADKQPETEMVVVDVEQSRTGDEPNCSQREQQDSQSQNQAEVGFLPIIRYGTPPPTPDSSAEGAAQMCKDKSKDKYPDAAFSRSLSKKEEPQKRAETHDSVRHTRQERIWLHLNYRGEAPFLQAWGLSITDLADRLEGLSILKDLMQAKAEGNEVTRDDGSDG